MAPADAEAPKKQPNTLGKAAGCAGNMCSGAVREKREAARFYAGPQLGFVTVELPEG